MSINIQKISDAITAKISAFDSSSSTSELVKIIESINNINARSGVITAPSKNALPTADSSNTGSIAFVRSTGHTDSAGTFYFGTGTTWDMLKTPSDSADSASANFIPSWSMAGKTYGYASGGTGNPSASINRYPFAAETTNAVGVGNLQQAGSSSRQRRYGSNSSSEASGYIFGGQTSPATPTLHNTTYVGKFPFASDTPAETTAGGTLGQNSTIGSATSMTQTDAYIMGGNRPGISSIIEKYTYASDAASNLGGSLYQASTRFTAASSVTHGYELSSYPPNSGNNRIAKFPFASHLSGGSTDIANLTVTVYNGMGLSSATHAYHVGGFSTTAPRSNVIEKMSFASEDNATDVGDLTSGKYFRASSGAQSYTHGYAVGGQGPSGRVNVIERFPFSVDGNGVDVGDLSAAISNMYNHFV